MKVTHSWLKEYVGEVLPSSVRIEELLTFHSFEVEGIETVNGEEVIDISVLPNRSSDCLSHRGIARELATILDTKLEKDPYDIKHTLKVGSRIILDIEDERLCSRFTAAVITGVQVGESPKWLRQQLVALGQRSVNNVVDATNYVMYGLGQPTHVLDLDKMGKDSEGRANITIRLGKGGETLTLLSGEVIETTEDTLHLVDGNTNVLLDLAGIKGGSAAELTDQTTNIVITSGNFNYQSVRKTSQRFKVVTDASQRFQNQPSPELAGLGLMETVSLILKLAGGECDGMVDMYPVKPAVMKTRVRTVAVNKLLGLQLTKDEVGGILRRVTAQVEEDADNFVVTAPFERTDLTIEEDYIEEVGRIYGLSHIKSVLPETVPLAEVNIRQYYSDKIRRALTEVGFSEVITSSFQKKGKIQLQNALASDKSCLRENLSKNVISVLDANYSHLDLLGLRDIRVFEIGTVFSKTDTGVGEHVSLVLGARTKGNGDNTKDDDILKEGVVAVDEALGIKLLWTGKEGVNEVDLSEVFATLPVPEAYDVLPEREPVLYKPISPYPVIARDIALWVQAGKSSDTVSEILLAKAGSLLVRHDLFDTFTKDGRTSYAFRLVFQAKDRTLTDGEVGMVMDNIYGEVKKQGWEVR